MLQDILFNLLPPCPFHALTGLYCPGCGSTRATLQLLKGDFVSAFRYNPLTVILLCVFAGYSLFYIRGRLRRKPVKGIFLRPFWIWLILVLILLFWVLRNIPVYPFTLLAPY